MKAMQVVGSLKLAIKCGRHVMVYFTGCRGGSVVIYFLSQRQFHHALVSLGAIHI
jgi:hypothetical protein